MPVLVLNCGSSSLRFALYGPDSDAAGLSGHAERLGTPDATLQMATAAGVHEAALADADHAAALRHAVEVARSHGMLLTAPDVIGHRIAHGGEHFSEPALVTPEVVEKIADCVHLAPLHNPGGLSGIAVAESLFPDAPQVVVFDTAFHQTIPEHAYLYALPRSMYGDHGVRRYGFHGTSHRYVSQKVCAQLGLDAGASRILTAHLGNGCSATAVLNGRSVDTTMGMTPLEGLVMGTRSGDIDPGLVAFLVGQVGMPLAGVMDMLNKESGLLGLSGISNDMRTLREHAARGDAAATLAIEIFCYRAARALASLTVPLGGLDVLVFTGGIGENDHETRARILGHLGHLGLREDVSRNTQHGQHSKGVITTSDSAVCAAVIPTDEELMIARLAAGFATT